MEAGAATPDGKKREGEKRGRRNSSNSTYASPAAGGRRHGGSNGLRRPSPSPAGVGEEEARPTLKVGCFVVRNGLVRQEEVAMAGGPGRERTTL